MTADAAARLPRARPRAPERLEALFAVQAALTPQAPALIHRGRTVSYAELEQHANRIAHHLADLGAGPGQGVGLCLRRTPQMVAAVLAVLKAGGAYLPLDPAYPAERLDFMLADSGARLLVSDHPAAQRLAHEGVRVDLDHDAAAIAGRPASAPPVAHGPADLAYVIYTSGSTGRPKGVMLGHTATALVEWARGAFQDGELARVAATTSLSFDPSVFEIFAPLCTGGTAVIKETALEPFAPDERPTLLNCVPSVLAELLRAGAVPASLMAVNVGGEPLKAGLVREAYRTTRLQAIYNHYGPTEATTCTTVARVPRGLEQDPPIGRPIAGAQVHLLDETGQPVRPGEVGEIHIGGPVLAKGYLRRPELTAERFRDDLLDGTAGRLYRTGDLGRWSPSGDLEFCGRRDDQVKVRGFRIELGEIEAALLRLPGVRNAVVLTREAAGRPRLTAYVETDAPLTLAETRDALRRWLPDHMLPAALVSLAAFPKNPSGKIDRRALPDPPARSEPAVPPGGGDLSRVEEAIAEAFRDILAAEAFGPDDSFFERGGDSLSSVSAALRLEELLGCSIPSAMIHQAPSPRLLAQALSRCPLDRPQRLSVLHPGGSKAPLFCVSDLFGLPFSYLSAARSLGAQRPVFGLSPGPQEAAFLAAPRIRTLTRAWLGDLREVQPRGPYLLAGYSAGGVLAFDLACALEAEGEEVRLILLDSAVGRSRPAPGALAGWATRQAGLLLKRRDPESRRRLHLLRRRLEHALTPGRLRRPPEWVPANRRPFAKALMRAYAAYRYGTFGGPVLMVKCLERDGFDELLDLDGLMGWQGALCGPVTLTEVDADHHGFMREPHAAEVARRIEAFVAEVREAAAEAA